MQKLTIKAMRTAMRKAYREGTLLAQHIKSKHSGYELAYFYRKPGEATACAVGACLPAFEDMPERFKVFGSLPLNGDDRPMFANDAAYEFAVKAQSDHDAWANSKYYENPNSSYTKETHNAFRVHLGLAPLK